MAEFGGDGENGLGSQLFLGYKYKYKACRWHCSHIRGKDDIV